MLAGRYAVNELIARARAFAIAAHAAVGQHRRYTGDPYHVHLKAVASLVQSVQHSAEMVAAAWLHDIREDTQVTHALLLAEFGADVAALVDELTDVSRPQDGSRSLRKSKDREHMASASAAAQTIKLADVIDNVSTIVRNAPDFARHYLLEKHALLQVLVRGDEVLQAEARRVHDCACADLGLVIAVENDK